MDDVGSRIFARIELASRRAPTCVKSGAIVCPWPSSLWQARHPAASMMALGSVLPPASPPPPPPPPAPPPPAAASPPPAPAPGPAARRRGARPSGGRLLRLGDVVGGDVHRSALRFEEGDHRPDLLGRELAGHDRHDRLVAGHDVRRGVVERFVEILLAALARLALAAPRPDRARSLFVGEQVGRAG